jgi:hypothetical protein
MIRIGLVAFRNQPFTKIRYENDNANVFVILADRILEVNRWVTGDQKQAQGGTGNPAPLSF